jgi:hypothetical protein
MPETIGYPAEAITAEHVEFVTDAQAKLVHGQRYRQQQREQVWAGAERLWKGEHWVGVNRGDPTADLTTVNICFSTVNTIQPYVTGEQPVFFMEAYGGGATEKNARLQEAFLNRTWRASETGAQVALEAAAFNYLVHGDGYLKATYDVVEVLTGVDETTEIAKLYVDQVSPWDVWLDPNSNGIANARWVCQRIYTTVEEIEGDDRYSVGDTPLTGGSRKSNDDDREDEGIVDTTEDWVILYEFYDIAARRLLTFVHEGEKPLQVVDEIDCPLVQMGNFEIPNSPYHMGELEQIKALQEELNKTRSEMMTHRRRNVAKIAVKERALTDAAKDAMASPIVGEWVPIKGDEPIDQLVRPFNMQPIPSDNYNMSQVIKDDVFEITGVTDFQRGATPDIRRSATEISVMEGASNVKLRAKLAAVEEAVRQCGILLVGIAKDVFPKTNVDELEMTLAGTEAERVNRLGAGEDAAAALEAGDLEGAARATEGLEFQSEATFVPNEEIFEGRYEVHVMTGSTEWRSPQAKAAKFEKLFTALTQAFPILAQAGINVNLVEVLRLWLEAEDVMDVEAILSGAAAPPPPAPEPAPAGLPPGAGAPNGAPPPEALPPELAALLGGGPPGQAPGPPMAPIGPENSGQFPPG